MRDTTAYIFMSDQSVNPADGSGNDYYSLNSEQTLYVVHKEGSKTLKAFTSYGAATGWDVGVSVPIIADQTSRYLGLHKIIGIVKPDGTLVGEVPNRKIRHGVFK